MNITELKPDQRNANKGTKRGRKALASSLEQFGTGRSILIDRNGRIVAGNKTVEEAQAAGILDVVVVQTDGTKLIAVQRTDLDLENDVKAKGLAIADNRTGQLDLEWDPAVLSELLSSDELDLKPFFTPSELATELAGEEPANDPNAEWIGMPQYSSRNLNGVRQLIVHFKTDEDVQDFAKLIGQEFSPKAKFIWHPKAQNADMASLKYAE